MDWKCVVNLESLEFETREHNTRETRGVKYEVAPAACSESMGAKKLGFNVGALKPGEFSCPYHFHHSEEELFIILEGKAMLRMNNNYREVKKGDLIFCSASPEGAHQLYNHTDDVCKYFALSNENDEFEVGEYPDSKKILVRKARKVFEVKSEVDYYKGEENMAAFWPKEILRK